MRASAILCLSSLFWVGSAMAMPLPETDAFGLPTWGGASGEASGTLPTLPPKDGTLGAVRLLGVCPGKAILLGRSVIRIGQTFAIREKGVRRLYELISVRSDGATVQGKDGEPQTIPFVRETEDALEADDPPVGGPRLSLRATTP